MRISGIIDYSMGNFLCIRGFAPMMDLSEISEPATDIQRSLIDEHKGEMEAFLTAGEFIFFPEVILCANLMQTPETSEKIEMLRETIMAEEKATGNIKIAGFNISTSISKRKKADNTMVYDRVQSVFLDFEKDKIQKLLRIDGNHRLSAVNENSSYKDLNIPFCLLLFRGTEETDKFCRALFHNINSKQRPLTSEENLKVILESEDVFTDDMLKDDPSFGYNYYLARKVKDFDLNHHPSVNRLISKNKNTYFVDLFKYLIDNGLLEKDSTDVEAVKSQLSEINSALEESGIANITDNIAVISAMSYYRLVSKQKYDSFVRWVKKNNIGLVEKLHMDDVIKIYDKVYENTPKKVFLARWYPKESEPEHAASEHRLNTIRAVVEGLGLKFVDLGTRISGTYDIRSVMWQEIASTDIFIADLTGVRHNVMVEVGYALKHVDTGRMIFYYQSTDVPFDLDGFVHHEITDSRDIELKIKPIIGEIIKETSQGE